jgi:hypothetical protein
MRIPDGFIEPLVILALAGIGIGFIACQPFGLDATSAASLAGALFGAAAVMLGNLLNRCSELKERKKRIKKIKTMITAELVNVTCSVIQAKEIIDKGMPTSTDSSFNLHGLDMRQYQPRPMPFTDDLGINLVELDNRTIDALVTLRSNLLITQEMMISIGNHASLSDAQLVSQLLKQNCNDLIKIFQCIAPDHTLTFSGQQPESVIEILKRTTTPKN